MKLPQKMIARLQSLPRVIIAAFFVFVTSIITKVRVSFKKHSKIFFFFTTVVSFDTLKR